MDKKEETGQSGESRQQDSNEVRGRIHNSQNADFENEAAANDISQVDQQEGNMNHGESGGNFSGDKEA